MSTLLELAPRDAGEAPGDVNVEFPEGATLNENVACYITCTILCGRSDCGHPMADDEV